MHTKSTILRDDIQTEMANVNHSKLSISRSEHLDIGKHPEPDVKDCCMVVEVDRSDIIKNMDISQQWALAIRRKLGFSLQRFGQVISTLISVVVSAYALVIFLKMLFFD